VSYVELPPPPELAAHVACLWISTGPATGPVLPDGCVDIVWRGADLVIAGPSTQAFGSATGNSEPRVGLRFRVGAAGAVIGQRASDLLNASPDVGDVWRRGDEITERVALADSPDAKLEILAEYVTKRVGDAAPIDLDVRRAALALSQPGTRLADIDGAVSERQLRRRFEIAVGYSPKTLARVLRLQRFLRLAGTGPQLAELAYLAGYADQSHLGRETIRLTGLSPKALLVAQFGPAGEPALNRLDAIRIG